MIVFVAKDTKEIYTGSECIPTVTNLPELAAMSTTMAAAGINGCNDLAALALKVYNTGATAITSMQIAYGSAVSGEQTFDWTGNITTDQEVFVEL